MEHLIQRNVPLHQYTTLHVGGVADYFARVRNVAELKEALHFARQAEVPVFILGGGSNVLVSDEGFLGLVILMDIKGREYQEVGEGQYHLHLGAGEILDEVVEETVEKNLWGLENLSTIPGTVGAIPVQNVGAYGVEVSSLIISVTAINIKTFAEKKFSNDECQFVYRDSFFKSDEGKQWCIVSVTIALTAIHSPKIQYADLALHQTDGSTPRSVRTLVQEIRSKKFPDWKVVGTAGSFFKNPLITKAAYDELILQYPDIPGYIQTDGRIKVSLGYILDKVCDLKGHCEGSVCLFERQALVLVANNGTTATEVKHFSDTIKEKVFLKTKINIECEVLFL
jgi:UDP-N-acetylmuramate dehydrogenase